MAARKFLLSDPAKPEGSDNPHTRAKIEDALIELMAEGARLTHDAAAERAKISRRTVYRYFPDQAALRAAIWGRMSPPGSVPASLDALLDGIAPRFAAFDREAPAAMVMMASAEGRAIRNQMRPELVARFRELFAEPTASLPEPDRRQAIAMLQFAGSSLAWREMRDLWGMDGEQIATACRWAIEVLLADLAKRGDKPLSEGPATRG